MRAKFLLISTISVLGLSSILLASPSFAEDDVFVDLSVLNSLGDNNSPVINDGPLFPIVKSGTRPAVKVKAAKKVSRPVAKKAAAKVKIPKRDKVKVEVEVKAPAPVSASVPTPTPVSVEPKAEHLPETAKDVELKDSPFAISAETPVKEEVSSAPIIPVEVKVEELPEPKAPVISEPINGHTPLPKTLENPVVNSSEPASIVEPVEEILVAEPIVQRPEVKINETVSSDIIFSSDSSELTEENKTQIDSIIAGFSDPYNNKIAIYAFNVDDGKDVFRKKRMSLNRAVEVRSYLLNKGYKNYSIKVINVDDESNKKNLVTIEELK